MASRTARAQISRETIDILEQGHYVGPAGRKVSILTDLDLARRSSILYSPAQFAEIGDCRDQCLRERGDRDPGSFQVVNETTLRAARRLIEDEGEARVLALNFASAKNPGGGFLKGSQAQEESLARASGLYACINPLQDGYEANRGGRSCLYTDHMICSPDVPVFRDDDDRLLDRPYLVSFLSAPAVNAGAVRFNEPNQVAQIVPVMRARIEKVLSVAVVQGHEALILGAWGCGVFANSPSQVADLFAELLTGRGLFLNAFRRVVFAVLDRSPDRSTITPFARRFTSPA